MPYNDLINHDVFKYKYSFLILLLSDLTDCLSSYWCCMAPSNKFFKSLKSKLLLYDASLFLQNFLAFEEFRVMS